MKRRKANLFVVLLIVVLVAGTAFAAPRLTIDESSFDFGYAPQHSKVSHVFWLKSTGDDTLKILNVKPG
jgi:hypothetical protein